MSNTCSRIRSIAAVALLFAASGAMAGDDWLIARVNGQWTWMRSGPEGRVQKKFLNQEVLRLGEKGAVEVVSLQTIQSGKVVRCSDRARHDPQDGCSSAFLDCKPTGGGVFSTLLGLVTGSGGMTDARNAYLCAINEDAVLEAAHAVGLIDGIPAKTRESTGNPEDSPKRDAADGPS